MLAADKQKQSVIPGDFTGFIAVVKRDCATCRLIEGALADMAGERDLLVYSQDDPHFPPSVGAVRDERELEFSYRHEIEIVPTLIQVRAGQETERLVGWRRDDWRRLTAMPALGEGLPAFSPGCGSKSVEPGMPDKRLAFKYRRQPLAGAPHRSGVTARRT